MPRPKDILTVRVQGHRTFTKGEHGKPGSLIDYSVKVDDIDCVTGETCNPLIPLTDRQMLFDAAAQGLLPDSQRHLLGAITSAERFFENAELHEAVDELRPEAEQLRAYRAERSRCGKEGKKPQQDANKARREEYLKVLEEIGFPSTPLSDSAMARWYRTKTAAWKKGLKLNKDLPSEQVLRKVLIPEFRRRH